jgi:hypothetical protein
MGDSGAQEESDCESNKSSDASQRRKYQRSQKFTRWNRANDKEAFKFLNIELEKAGLTFDNFFAGGIEANNAILMRVLINSNWQRSVQALFDRLQKVKTDAQTFSVRNLRELKRKIKKRSPRTNNDFAELVYQFPGTTIEIMKDAVSEIKNKNC